MRTKSLITSRRNRPGRALFVAFALCLAASRPVVASEATARCNSLEQQLAIALKAHAGPKAAKAATLGTQAHKLCSNSRPALGLRTYIKAFRTLGVDPELPKD